MSKLESAHAALRNVAQDITEAHRCFQHSKTGRAILKRGTSEYLKTCVAAIQASAERKYMIYRLNELPNNFFTTEETITLEEVQDDLGIYQDLLNLGTEEGKGYAVAVMTALRSRLDYTIKRKIEEERTT